MLNTYSFTLRLVFLFSAVFVQECTHSSDQRVPTPLYKADMNPLTLGYVVSDAVSSTTLSRNKVRWQASFNVANTVQLETDENSEETILLDAESKKIRLGIEYGLTDEWMIGLDLPYIEHSRGSLDSPVDEFHKIFGFPEGPRGSREKGLLAINYTKQGQPLVQRTSSSAGIGDIGVSLTGRIITPFLDRVTVSGKFKFPTGDHKLLTGSGTHDVALWVSVVDSIGQDFAHFFTIGGALIEQDKGLLEDMRVDHFGFLSYGIAWHFNPSIDLKVQLDSRSAIYNQTDLLPLKSSTAVSIGASFALGDRYQLDLAVVEDIHVGSAPDVVFQLNFLSKAIL
ncbi:MAG: DUF3187 family protein [Porticoccaceae bacterium]|nr:DUF3187 family protein [Porticoccaceae bacterium]MDG1474715.1 DUF3187 family protein [Porticoccaceae bacterium]